MFKVSNKDLEIVIKYTRATASNFKDLLVNVPKIGLPMILSLNNF